MRLGVWCMEHKAEYYSVWCGFDSHYIHLGAWCTVARSDSAVLDMFGFDSRCAHHDLLDDKGWGDDA